MTEKNPKVDAFLVRNEQWRAEFTKLREIILGCGLTEELKWGVPTYDLNGKNVVLIHGFKEYCAILFVKGALLKDPLKALIQQTENVQAGRQIRFTDVDEVVELEPVLKAYIQEAVDVEKAGLKVPHKTTAEYAVPEEFQARLDEDSALKTAFEALTPGRQRGYLFYFSQPKLSQTRAARVEKYVPQILAGKGLNDE
jgi:uncharacterized protein YdeI (YjbR/CyaY-like superfamily)